MKPTVLISISESGIPAVRTYLCGITINGQKIMDRGLSPIESQQIGEIHRKYASLFEKDCRVSESVHAANDYLDIIGEELFHLIFEFAWGNLKPKMEVGADFIIVSPVPEILGLPWEFLKFPDGSVMGFDPRFSLRRFPKNIEMQSAYPLLSSGPLRILFIACKPLDYEKEELAMLRLIGGLDAVLRIGDTGSFEELGKQVETFRPHILHLVGQGKLKDGVSYFSFESEAGRPDWRDASDLGTILSMADVQCLLFGGCQTENAQSLDLFCLKLLDTIPLAMAWNASTESASIFYRTLASGMDLNHAILASRLDIREKCQRTGIVVPLPVLYGCSQQSQLFENQKRSEYHSTFQEQLALPGLTEGYAEDFVDRKNDLQRLSLALGEGTVRTLLITGSDGSGKSVLATKLALDLTAEGYSLIAVYSSNQNPLSAPRFLEAYISFLSRTNRAEEAKPLKDHSITISERLKSLLDALERDKLLLLLDGLELDDNLSKIRDRELAQFYLDLLRKVDAGRVIITITSLPADAMTLPKRCWEWNLQGLAESDFIKYLLKEDSVAEQYRLGALTYDQFESLFVSSAGKPCCLAQTRKAIGSGWRAKTTCQDAIVHLFSSLSQVSGQALSRSAVYGIAMGIKGLAGVSGENEDKVAGFVQEWTGLSLVFQPHPQLYAISPSARVWLLSQLNQRNPDWLKDAHRAAGSYLNVLAAEGHADELGLSRLDCFMECRGHYLVCGDLDRAREVNSRISGYMEKRGYYHELLKINGEILEREAHIDPMNWIAAAYMGAEDYHRAQEWYEMVLETKPGMRAYLGLGTSLFRQGKYGQARESFEKALEICRELGNHEDEAIALEGLAIIEMELKQDDAALKTLQEMLSVQDKMGDLRGKAITLSRLASLELGQKKFGDARKKLTKALEIMNLIKDKHGQASVLYNMASIDLEKGDLDAAYDEFQRSLELKRDLGETKSQASIFHQLGLIETQKGLFDEANESFLGSLKIYQSLDDKSGEAGALFQLGALALQRDRIEEGLRLMALSTIILRIIGSDEIKNVEPMVERLASQLEYSQDQFLKMVREVSYAYRKDRGWSLVELALRK
jgi:tetratricopeptide (TPR) repeat protein